MLQDQTVPMAPEGIFPSQLTLAMAYVPYQSWEEPLSEEQALEAGTVFPSLVKPFLLEKGGSRDADVTAVFGQNGKG